MLSASLLSAAPESVVADLSAASDDAVFIRIDVDKSGRPRSLQTAIAGYEGRDASRDLRVDLVGVVHIGDRDYYETLNERFRGYDAVLYEMVAPAGATVPGPGESHRGLMSGAQLALRSILDLEFQLDVIDYAAPNFVHADLSPEELRASMAERGESLYVYLWRAFYASMREASRDPIGVRDWSLLTSILLSRDRVSLKAAIAQELTGVDDVTGVLEAGSGSAIIAARNRRAMDVLEASLADGARRVAVFYGVAHLRDFAERLRERFDMQAADTGWVDAWQLAPADESGP